MALYFEEEQGDIDVVVGEDLVIDAEVGGVDPIGFGFEDLEPYTGTAYPGLTVSVASQTSATISKSGAKYFAGSVGELIPYSGEAFEVSFTYSPVIGSGASWFGFYDEVSSDVVMAVYQNTYQNNRVGYNIFGFDSGYLDRIGNVEVSIVFDGVNRVVVLLTDVNGIVASETHTVDASTYGDFSFWFALEGTVLSNTVSNLSFTLYPRPTYELTDNLSSIVDTSTDNPYNYTTPALLTQTGDWKLRAFTGANCLVGNSYYEGGTDGHQFELNDYVVAEGSVAVVGNTLDMTGAFEVSYLLPNETKDDIKNISYNATIKATDGFNRKSTSFLFVQNIGEFHVNVTSDEVNINGTVVSVPVGFDVILDASWNLVTGYYSVEIVGYGVTTGNVIPTPWSGTPSFKIQDQNTPVKVILNYLNIVSSGLPNTCTGIESTFNVNVKENPPKEIYSIPQGDPKMFISPDGMTLNFINGVPVMDDGLQNLAVISLGTLRGFALNKVASNGGESVGSDFITESLKSITRNQIRVVEDAAEKSFGWAVDEGLIQEVTASIGIGESGMYELTLIITPPTGENRILVYSKNGENWINQKWGA